MTAIRTKDKIFLAVVVPSVLAAAYFWHFRPAAAAKLVSLEARDAATVTHEEYPGEKRVKTAALENAQAELEAERAEKAPPPEVTGSAADTPARRTHDVVAVFRGAGMRVVSVAAAGDPSGCRASRCLAATSVRPAPQGKVYVLEGGFAALRKALGVFASRKMAVIVRSLVSEGADKWKVEIHE